MTKKRNIISVSILIEVVSNGRIYDVTPTEETYKAINTELESQLDNEITAFRMSHYHSFGTPKFHYKNHYFSID